MCTEVLSQKKHTLKKNKSMLHLPTDTGRKRSSAVAE